MVFASHPLELEQWQASFYSGDRLKAEVQLLASSLSGRSKSHLLAGSLLLSASHGHSSRSPSQVFSVFSFFQTWDSHKVVHGIFCLLIVQTRFCVGFRHLPSLANFLRVDDYMFYDDQPVDAAVSKANLPYRYYCDTSGVL